MEKCRLCYTDSNPDMCQHIFNTKFEPPIWQIIEQLSNLKITKNDPYTKNICSPCFNNLVKYSDFRRHILDTDYRIQHEKEQLSEKTDNDDFMIKEEEEIEIEEDPLKIGKNTFNSQIINRLVKPTRTALTIKKRRLLNNAESETEEENFNEPPRKKKHHQNPPSPVPELMDPLSSSSIILTDEQAQRNESSGNASSTNTTTNETHASFNPHDTLNDQHLNIDIGTMSYLEVLNKISQFPEKMMKLLSMMFIEIKDMKQRLDGMQPQVTTVHQETLQDVSNYFPFENKQELLFFENDLNAGKNVNEFKIFVTKIGGKNEGDFLKNVFSTVYSKAFAKDHTWYGKKNHFNLSELTVNKIIREAIQSKFENFTLSDFNSEAGEWFRLGSQRLKRKMNY